MKLTVKGKKYSIGYALWTPNKLKGETAQAFLSRIQGIDDALRECDKKRVGK